MKKVINFWSIVLILFFSACSNGLKSGDYVKYVVDPKNGLQKKIAVGDWVYTLQYTPCDYMLLLESHGKMQDKEVVSRRDALRGTAWFNISFMLIKGNVSPLQSNVASSEEYNERLNYFLNEAKGDVRLIYGTDTLRPSAYLFENNYNLAPKETIVVGFNLPSGADRPGKDMLLSFTDQVFKNGIIKTKYSLETINSIPNLIY